MNPVSRRLFCSSCLLGTGGIALGCTGRRGVLQIARAMSSPKEGNPAAILAQRAQEVRQEARPLLVRYPTLAAALPWLDLGGLPTPVTRARVLGQRLGLHQLYIKRDDEAGHQYGGSKARKLELLLAEARVRGNSTILTFGGVGSNHALATAVHTRREGFGCVLGLLPERPSDHARAHLLAEHHLGCEQYRTGSTDDASAQRIQRHRSSTDFPYIIPAGGTSALGNVGLVNAAFELAEQCQAGVLPVPDELYVSAGTLGTAAGLYVGLRAVGLDTRLVAVRASNPGTGSLRNLYARIEETAQFIRNLDPSFPPTPIRSELLHLEHGAAGSGYAVPTPAGSRAISLASETESLELDATYTGKALAALIHDIPRLASGSGRNVLFWNTYDSRHIGWGDTTPQDLAAEFRGYF